jgi:hypothetical protein
VAAQVSFFFFALTLNGAIRTDPIDDGALLEKSCWNDQSIEKEEH